MACLDIGGTLVTACAAREEPPFGNYVRVSVAHGVSVEPSDGWPAQIATLHDSLDQPPAQVVAAIDAAEVVVLEAIRQRKNVVFCCRQGQVRSAAVACGVFKRFRGSQAAVDRFLRQTRKMRDSNLAVQEVFAPVVRSTIPSPRPKRVR
jgi:protein-tyrosine phosphatase